MTFSDFNLQRTYKRHPLLSQFSSSLPSTIKELFSWMEFIIHNNAIAGAGIKKLSETPVTNFKYSADGDMNEETSSNSNSWKSIVEDDLNLKSELLNISYNTLLYGNCFVSVYSPISRMLECGKCKTKVSIREAGKLKTFLNSDKDRKNVNQEKEKEDNSKNNDISKKFKKTNKIASRVGFSCICETCNKETPHKAIDYKLKQKDAINIITWNPHDISISSNQISGEEECYYKIPDTLKESIKSNDPLILATVPIPMIEASLSSSYFKFGKGTIYHSKREVVSGVSTSWGMPTLTSAIPSFLSLMILRKANEKIASDYMVPLRTVFPTQGSGNSEFYNFMGGSDFVSKINGMINQWKTDPSGVQVTPFPIGTETILGDGKLLLLNQEIDQLESNIANSLGIPIEFIKGGLSYTAQGSSLRLLENQLSRMSANLEDVIDFIVEKTGQILDKTPIKIKLVPFKIIDDLAEKSAIIQLAMSGQNKISAGTLFELFNLDAGSEQKRIMAEQKGDVKQNLELQGYQQEIASSIEERARSAAQMSNNNFSNINQQALMEEAQGYVQQLMQMDDGARKSQLDEMSKTNYVMYGTVKALLDMQKGKQDYAAIQNGKEEQPPQ